MILSNGHLKIEKPIKQEMYFYVNDKAVNSPLSQSWTAKIKLMLYVSFSKEALSLRGEFEVLLKRFYEKLNEDSQYTVIEDLIIDLKNFWRTYFMASDEKNIEEKIQFAGLLFYKDRFLSFNYGLIEIFKIREGKTERLTFRQSVADEMVRKGRISKENALQLDTYWALQRDTKQDKNTILQHIYYSESQACYENEQFIFLDWEDAKLKTLTAPKDAITSDLDWASITYTILGIEESRVKSRIGKKLIFIAFIFVLGFGLYYYQNELYRGYETLKAKYFSKEKEEIHLKQSLPRNTLSVNFILEENLEAEPLPLEEEKVEPTPEPIKPEEKSTQPKYQEYVVQKGDSLSKISQKFYGDKNGVQKIVRFNELKNANVIRVGMKLKIPMEE